MIAIGIEQVACIAVAFAGVIVGLWVLGRVIVERTSARHRRGVPPLPRFARSAEPAPWGAGDLAFVSGLDPLISVPIEKVEGGSGPCDGRAASHVAWLVEEDDGSIWVYEMTSPVCRRTPAAEWFDPSARTAWLAHRRVPLTEAQKLAIRQFSREQLGHVYDYIQVPVLWLWLQARRFAWWAGLSAPPAPPRLTGVCSENAIAALERVGDPIGPWRIDPEDLVCLPWMQPLMRIPAA